MLVTQNPWDALGYQAMEDACLLFDQQAFMSAAKLLDEARQAAGDGTVKRSLTTLHQLCEGYALWDRFQHKEAVQRIKEVLKNAVDLRVVLGQTRGEAVIRGIKQDQRVLQRLVDQPRSRTAVADLLANARRREAEARYDDGVARLYRAIEALAQLALSERHQISSTADVALETVPPPLRDEWACRAEGGRLLLGLQDSFELLHVLGDEAGKKFKVSGLDDRQRSPLAARNQSILAHGFQPVGANIFEKLWNAAMDLGGFTEQDLPTFPRLAMHEDGQ